MASTAKVIDIEAGIEHEVATRAAKGRSVKVVEVGSGIAHELPGDTPTRDARTLAYFAYPSGAVLPLAIRAPDAVFYLGTDEESSLFGKLVRRCA